MFYFQTLQFCFQKDWGAGELQKFVIELTSYIFVELLNKTELLLKMLCVPCQQQLSKISKLRRMFIKGVLHPRPFFWLFMHFSQKLQHISNK